MTETPYHVPLRIVCFTDRQGIVRWRWDYRTNPTSVPFLACTGDGVPCYFDSYDHWQSVTRTPALRHVTDRKESP